MFWKKKQTNGGDDSVTFDVAWGGFYSQQDEEGTWVVFRLLDFNRDAYHAMVFRDRFEAAPTFEQVTALDPFAGHIPVATGQLVNYPATLLGERPLTVDDLYGYDAYLEHAGGLPSDEREAFLTRLVGFSHEPTLSFNLRLDANGELDIAEA